MSRNLPAICLLEPLSLLGRELLQLMEERGPRPERVLEFHLGRDDDQQVAEILGEPALVQPLTAGEQVPEEAPLVIAGPVSEERRPVLRALLAQRPTQPVLDLAGTGLVRGPVLTGPPEAPIQPPQVVLASPGAAAVAGLVRPLREFGVRSISAVVEVPASARGREAVESLARRAAARLQGLPPEEAPGTDSAPAFDLVPNGEGRTAADLRQLLPGVEIAAFEVRVGMFHGWTVHLGLRLAEPVHPERLGELWKTTGNIVLDGPEFRLSGTVESDRIHVGPLAVSEAGGQVAVTAAVDGLRLAAAAALEILPVLV